MTMRYVLGAAFVGAGLLASGSAQAQYQPQPDQRGQNVELESHRIYLERLQQRMQGQMQRQEGQIGIIDIQQDRALRQQNIDRNRGQQRGQGQVLSGDEPYPVYRNPAPPGQRVSSRRGSNLGQPSIPDWRGGGQVSPEQWPGEYDPSIAGPLHVDYGRGYSGDGLGPNLTPAQQAQAQRTQFRQRQRLFPSDEQRPGGYWTSDSGFDQWYDQSQRGAYGQGSQYQRYGVDDYEDADYGDGFDDGNSDADDVNWSEFFERQENDGRRYLPSDAARQPTRDDQRFDRRYVPSSSTRDTVDNDFGAGSSFDDRQRSYDPRGVGEGDRGFGGFGSDVSDSFGRQGRSGDGGGTDRSTGNRGGSDGSSGSSSAGSR